MLFKGAPDMQTFISLISKLAMRPEDQCLKSSEVGLLNI